MTCPSPSSLRRSPASTSNPGPTPDSDPNPNLDLTLAPNPNPNPNPNQGTRRPVLADEHGRYTDDYTAADEHFALRRTVSRLAEMQGMQYYMSSGTSHTRHPAEGHPGRW